MTPNEPPLTQLGRALKDVEDLREAVGTLTTTLNTERATARRFRLNMVGLVLLSLLNLVGVSFAYLAAERGRETSDTIEDCQIVGGECFERLARNGQLGSNRLMDFNGCMLLRLPETRDEADIEQCRKQADDRFFENLKNAEKEVDTE